MNPLIYLNTINKQIDLYIGLLAILAPLHWWLAKRLAVNIFDPLFMVIFADWFGFALVTFMHINGDIRAEYFQYYTCSQLTLYTGLISARAISPKNCTLPFNPPLALVKWIMFFAFSTHLSATAIKWGLTGIPLFNVSRLGAFAGSGGLGIIERFETGAFYIFSFSLMLALVRFREKFFWTSLAGILWITIYIAFSGSKSALLGLMQVYFLLRHLASGGINNTFYGTKGGAKAFGIAALFSIFVLTIQSQGNLQEALFALAFRLVSFGDIYIYAYIDDTLRYIQGDNPIIGLFGGILSTFRIIPGEWIYKNMGLQFFEIVFPHLDYLAGPNPRHNVFGFHFFGWRGLIFSLIIGFLLGRLQYRLYRRANARYFGVLWSYLLYFSLVSLIGDFDYSLSIFTSVLISAVAVLVPAQLAFLTSRPKASLQHAPR